MNYYERAEKLATRNTDPTLTDQSAAQDCDINVIVKRFNVAGMLPQTIQQPRYDDFSDLPDNLRDAIDKARSFKKLQAELPEPLRGKSVDELTKMTPDELTAILSPPKPAEPKKEEPKT